MTVKTRRRKKKLLFPLKDILAACNSNQWRLSKASGIPFATINAIACGRQTPSWPILLRIATTLGLDLGDLVPRKGVQHGRPA